ncbi:uncharacterized protein LOC142861641 [Microcebus murinus]|uniref:uncharacterized protein LOC142861641 n=1 Tax=Microcebus murinus TaxID=30608 RepID=UPI003F6CEFBC
MPHLTSDLASLQGSRSNADLGPHVSWSESKGAASQRGGRQGLGALGGCGSGSLAEPSPPSEKTWCLSRLGLPERAPQAGGFSDGNALLEALEAAESKIKMPVSGGLLVLAADSRLPACLTGQTASGTLTLPTSSSLRRLKTDRQALKARKLASLSPCCGLYTEAGSPRAHFRRVSPTARDSVWAQPRRVTSPRSVVPGRAGKGTMVEPGCQRTPVSGDRRGRRPVRCPRAGKGRPGPSVSYGAWWPRQGAWGPALCPALSSGRLSGEPGRRRAGDCETSWRAGLSKRGLRLRLPLSCIALP